MAGLIGVVLGLAGAAVGIVFGVMGAFFGVVVGLAVPLSPLLLFILVIWLLAKGPSRSSAVSGEVGGRR